MYVTCEVHARFIHVVPRRRLDVPAEHLHSVTDLRPKLGLSTPFHGWHFTRAVVNGESSVKLWNCERLLNSLYYCIGPVLDRTSALGNPLQSQKDGSSSGSFHQCRKVLASPHLRSSEWCFRRCSAIYPTFSTLDVSLTSSRYSIMPAFFYHLCVVNCSAVASR
jgi:hypothetical protein